MRLGLKNITNDSSPAAQSQLWTHMPAVNIFLHVTCMRNSYLVSQMVDTRRRNIWVVVNSLNETTIMLIIICYSICRLFLTMLMKRCSSGISVENGIPWKVPMKDVLVGLARNDSCSRKTFYDYNLTYCLYIIITFGKRNPQNRWLSEPFLVATPIGISWRVIHPLSFTHSCKYQLLQRTVRIPVQVRENRKVQQQQGMKLTVVFVELKEIWLKHFAFLTHNTTMR